MRIQSMEKVGLLLGRLLDPLTQDACAFYEDHAFYSEYNGVVYDTDEGDRIAGCLGDRKALILANHGNLTVERDCRCSCLVVYNHGEKLSGPTCGGGCGDAEPHR